jgi:uncharacterized phage-associated protein
MGCAPKNPIRLRLRENQSSAAFHQYKACKLLFLADKRHLVRYGRPLTGDKYCALPYGPIPSETRDLIKALVEEKLENPNVAELNRVFDLDRHFSCPHLIAKEAFDPDLLSKSDLEVLEEVVREYGNKSFAELKMITHGTVAFSKAWDAKSPKKSFAMNFEDFFEEDENAVKGALQEMKENFPLRKYVAK